MKSALVAAVGCIIAAALSGASCGARQAEELDKLGTVRITIKGKPFELWIADAYAEQQQGLMHVSAERMAPLPDGAQRGMIFVFDHEQHLNFWMKNTIIPLDIAYVNAAGRVVGTHTMAPLDDRIGQYPSGAPALYAIEVNAGVFNTIGLRVGDSLEIPASLKRTP